MITETSPKLSVREELFVSTLMRGSSLNKAALKAGYSVKNPQSAAQRLLKRPRVAARLEEMKRARAGAVELTQKQIAGRLSNLADEAANAADYATAYRCLMTLLEWTKDRAEDKPVIVASTNDEKEIAAEAEERRARLQAQLEIRKAA